jgi:hypothetical protein
MENELGLTARHKGWRLPCMCVLSSRRYAPVGSYGPPLGSWEYPRENTARYQLNIELAPVQDVKGCANTTSCVAANWGHYQHA